MLHTNILKKANGSNNIQLQPITIPRNHHSPMMTLIDDYISGLSPLSYGYFNR
jgi:hypothetical protein